MKFQQKINFLFLILSSVLNHSLTQNTISTSIDVNGQTRSFRIYIPAIYNPNTPVPLVLNFHGYTSSNIVQESYGDFRAIADTANFILVHPQGLNIGGGNGWNSFANTDPSNYDYIFIDQLIDYLAANYSIQLENVFSTGLSNGGFFSYDLACFLSHRIRAIASVAGSMIQSHLNGCNLTKKTPVMQIHGTNDATISYNGTGGIINSVAIEDLVNFWVDKNQCITEPIVATIENTNTTDMSTVDHYLYKNLDGFGDVEFYKVLNGGHTWPGSTINVTGIVTNKDINASKEIWKFFYRNKLENQSAQLSELSNKISVFPNPSSDFITFQNMNFNSNEIQIIDIFGRIYLAKIQNKQISVRELNPGVYFIKISDTTIKFVKE
jgi:polyhydroxybutyrate depolymerase